MYADKFSNGQPTIRLEVNRDTTTKHAQAIINVNDFHTNSFVKRKLEASYKSNENEHFELNFQNSSFLNWHINKQDDSKIKYLNFSKIVIDDAEDLKDVNDVCVWVGDPAVDGFLY